MLSSRQRAAACFDSLAAGAAALHPRPNLPAARCLSVHCAIAHFECSGAYRSLAPSRQGQRALRRDLPSAAAVARLSCARVVADSRGRHASVRAPIHSVRALLLPQSASESLGPPECDSAALSAAEAARLDDSGSSLPSCDDGDGGRLAAGAGAGSEPKLLADANSTRRQIRPPRRKPLGAKVRAIHRDETVPSCGLLCYGPCCWRSTH